MAKTKKKGGVSASAWAKKADPGFERPALSLPSGVKMYTPKKGKAAFSIVPANLFRSPRYRGEAVHVCLLC
jgi:hypothetical protein